MSSLEYLPPGTFCTVDYPVRLKQNGRYSQILCRVSQPEYPGPFYILDCTLWDSLGKLILSKTTFIVPSREPSIEFGHFNVEWDTDFAVFVVRDGRNGSKGHGFPYLPQIPGFTSWNPLTSADLTASQSNNKASCRRQAVDELFDIEYLHPARDEDDESEYDSGLVSLRNKVEPPENPPDELGSPNADVQHESQQLGKQNNPSKKTDGSDNATTSPKSYDPLLQPDNFDWADEVEESGTLQPWTPSTEPQKTIPSANESIVMLIDGPALDARGYISPGVPGLAVTADSYTQATTPKDEEDIATTDVVSKYTTLNDDDNSNDNNNNNDNSDNSNSDNSNNSNPKPKTRKTPAEQERDWQTYLLTNYTGIHHFNWLGDPMLERSYTSPETSLFIILSKPKTWLFDNTRKGITLRQALKWIDPVLFTGKMQCLWHWYYRNHTRMRLEIRTFLKAITGQVFQFYTGGLWREDKHEWEQDTPLWDPADPSIYPSTKWLPVNGWLKTEISPTRYEYLAGAIKHVPRKRFVRPEHRVRGKSPLRNCMVQARD